MCGRDYSTFTEDELHYRYLNRKTWPWAVNKLIPSFKSNYNTCPTHECLVLNVEADTLKFELMRWGLVPAWASSVKDADKYSMINAKAEEISQKKSYKVAFKKRRCIVPVSGFFEWQRTGEKKRPFAIHLKDNPIMSLAGIWEHWESSETEEVVRSFALLTTQANSFMSKIHTRMPVILAESDETAWLDPKLSDEAVLEKLMAPSPSEWLDCFEVSTLVNSPRNNSAEVLKKLAVGS